MTDSRVVVGLGPVLVDHVSPVLEFPPIPGVVRGAKTRFAPEEVDRHIGVVCARGQAPQLDQVGGPVPVALKAHAHLGDTARFIGAVADDGAGELIGSRLDEWGVEVQFDLQRGRRSGFSLVLVDEHGERTIAYSSGTLEPLSAGLVEQAVGGGFLDGAAMVHIDAREPEAALRLAHLAQQRDVPVYLDTGDLKERSPELLAVASYIQAPKRFVDDLYGGAHSAHVHPAEGSELLRREFNALAAVVTDGPRGYAVSTRGRTEMVPAIRVSAVDDTGAGDVFAGAMAHGIMQGRSAFVAAQFANTMAGMFCETFGNDALSNPHALESRLRAELSRQGRSGF